MSNDTRLQAVLWGVVFYVTSALGGVMNKQLIKAPGEATGVGVDATTLTAAHLFFSVCCDVVFVRAGLDPTTFKRRAGSDHAPAAGMTVSPTYRRRDVTFWAQRFWDFTPVALMLVAAKLTTYASYSSMSMALTHTAKALEPFFNVAIAALVFKEVQPCLVYASLVPITSGVFMSSSTEESYNHLGFFFAVLSALFKVLQNMLMKKYLDRSRDCAFFEIHLVCGVSATAIMGVVLAFEAAFDGRGVVSGGLPWRMLFSNSLMQYLSSVSSVKFLQLVSVLTFTITNGLKRAFIVAVAMLYFAMPVTLVNTLGVIFAMGGGIMYHYASTLTRLSLPAEAGANPRPDRAPPGGIVSPV